MSVENQDNRNPATEIASVSKPERIKPRIKYPKKTLGYTALAALIVPSAAFVVSASQANSLNVEHQLKGVHVEAVVDSVTVGIEPVVISQNLAKTNTTITAEDTADILWQEDVVVHRTWLKRKGLAEANYQFDPSRVSASYSSLEDSVTITVPSASITTRMEMVTGETKTTNIGDAGFKFPLRMLEDLRESMDGFTQQDSSQDEIWKGLVDETLDVNETLEVIADLSAAKAVDEKCTEEIQEIPGFTDAFEDQIEILAEKEVLASQFLIGDEFKLTPEKRYELITNAKMVFENNGTYEIGHDLEIAKALEIATSELETKNEVSTASCEVTEDTKFIVKKYGE